MFPGHGEHLLPAAAIDALAQSGLVFDPWMYPAIVVDEAGHLEHGDKVELAGPPAEELEERAVRGEQFLAECRDRALAFTLLLHAKYTNPYMALGWSRRLFRNLSHDEQERYWKLIRVVAQRSNAAYIIVVNDPPDYFEDRFLEVDDRRWLDKQLPSGATYDFRAIWISTRAASALPEGVSSLPGNDVGEGFREYSVE
ncbi:hypothetical protein BE11_24805 [Sorangium cellulosum]|nr:hypothetical protein BE11_24805 [Sorangium cellulosum]